MTNYFYAVILARFFLCAAAITAYCLFALPVRGADQLGLLFGTADLLLLAIGASIWAQCEWQEIAASARFRRG